MALAADTNWGFKGEVTSAQTPTVLGRGSRFSAETPGSLKVTPGGGGDRAVTVAAGSVWGDGVLSIWNEGAVLNGSAPPGTSTRWDTVVVRREWTPEGDPTGTATLMLLSGSAAAAISTSRTTDAGVTTSDQPIALVRFQGGQTDAREIRDLRCWAGDGGLVAVDSLALDYLAELPGTRVTIGGDTYTRVLTEAGAAYWDRLSSGGREVLHTVNIPATNNGASARLAYRDIPAEPFARVVETSGAININGVTGPRWRVVVTSAGDQVSSNRQFAADVNYAPGLTLGGSVPVSDSFNLNAGQTARVSVWVEEVANGAVCNASPSTIKIRVRPRA